MRVFLKAMLVMVSFTFILTGQAQEIVSGDAIYEKLGIDFESAEITTETVSPGLHVLFGIGGNVAASIGEQGVLVVDDQFPAMVPKIEAAIEALGGDDIDFVINTHWHFDHTDGNPMLAESGGWIVAHENSRQMMTESHLINLVRMQVEQPASSQEGLPVITYDNGMRFHFNGQQIDLLHFGPAHTTGDSAVLFRGSNVVHMGDVYFSQSYPFIDSGNGGDLNGVIRFCEAVLEEINPETIVIPGHGKLATYADLAEYVAMLGTIRDRIAVLIEEGATLEEVIAAKPTAAWDEALGDPGGLLNRAYFGMTR